MEIYKTDMKKLVNVSAGFNDLQTKPDDLDVGKLTTVPRDLLM